MKRFILIAASVLGLLFVSSCDKDSNEQVDPNAPKIAWEANPSFARVEISTKLNTNIAFEAPDGVAALTCTATELPTGYYLLCNRIIQNDDNWGDGGSKSPVMDLISDYLTSSVVPGTGSSLKGRKAQFQIDVMSIYYAIVGDANVPNDSRFSFRFELTDSNGKVVKKTVALHYTVGPTITVNPQLVELNTETPACKVTLKVPGGIESLELRFSTTSQSLISWLDARAGGLTTDLVENTVLDSYGLPVGKSVSGKTELSLDLGKLLKEIKFSVMNEGDSEHSITFRVIDNNGKETSDSMVAHYTYITR